MLSEFFYPSRRLGISSRASVYIIAEGVSHHALACIHLRLDDIQCFALMICNSLRNWWYTRLRRDLARMDAKGRGWIQAAKFLSLFHRTTRGLCRACEAEFWFSGVKILHSQKHIRPALRIVACTITPEPAALVSMDIMYQRLSVNY